MIEREECFFHWPPQLPRTNNHIMGGHLRGKARGFLWRYATLIIEHITDIQSFQFKCCIPQTNCNTLPAKGVKFQAVGVPARCIWSVVCNIWAEKTVLTYNKSDYSHLWQILTWHTKLHCRVYLQIIQILGNAFSNLLCTFIMFAIPGNKIVGFEVRTDSTCNRKRRNDRGCAGSMAHLLQNIGGMTGGCPGGKKVLQKSLRFNTVIDRTRKGKQNARKTSKR